MIAYRVYLMGTNDTYLITEKQKPMIESAMQGASMATVQIGGAVVRANQIKRIAEVNINLDSCPDYFIKRVEKERGNAVEPAILAYRRLPKRTIIIDLDGKIIAEDLGRMTLCRLTKERPLGKAVLATCHYKVGENGQRQYYTKLDQIPEARAIMFDPDYPHDPMVEGLYWYGVKQDIEKVLEQANKGVLQNAR